MSLRMLLLYFYIILPDDLEMAGLILSVWVTVNDILTMGWNLALMSDQECLVINTFSFSAL